MSLIDGLIVLGLVLLALPLIAVVGQPEINCDVEERDVHRPEDTQ